MWDELLRIKMLQNVIRYSVQYLYKQFFIDFNIVIGEKIMCIFWILRTGEFFLVCIFFMLYKKNSIEKYHNRI